MTSSSCPSPYARYSFECRPKLLKDFLRDDAPSYTFSTAFRPSSLKACKSKSQRVVNFRESKFIRSKSSRAASATISAFHKVINIVKFLPFVSVKSQNILPRSISRKLSRRSHKDDNKSPTNHEVSGSIKVKDILRWQSSKDLMAEKFTPLDYAYSPYRCITTTTTTTTTTTSTTTNSWCESDFTAEDLPSWDGKINEEGVGDYCMGETRGIKLDPKENLLFDENDEQYSPVSVLESPFHDEGYKMHYNDTKCMLLKRIQEFDESHVEVNNTSFKEEINEEEQEMIEIEEKANQLLKETQNYLCTKDFERNNNVDQLLLLDFFVHELFRCRNLQENVVDESSERMLMREVKSWMNGEYNEEFEWEIEEKRMAYINDMKRLGSWNDDKFEEEKEELILDLEFDLFNDLINEVLVDISI